MGGKGGGKNGKGKGKGGKGSKGGFKGGKGTTKKDAKVRKQQLNEKELKILTKKVEKLAEDFKAETFEELPLSTKTLHGLRAAGYTEPTEVQRLTIPPALKGRDVLGAAKTGSGKTLSFVIPCIELLFRKRWSEDAGLGAVIISPTRELASQIFDVVKVAGKYHNISGGLIIGGANIEEEQGIVSLNLVVATPGRLLHHIDATQGFQLDEVMILVLDEADRLLDMGFKDTLNHILDALPKPLQTLLFSATQTKDLDALTRLAVRDPFYVSVHSGSRYVTPKKLCQNFAVVEVKDKITALYSFLKKFPREKVIVFVATCNQVKFLYLALSRLLKKSGGCSMCLTGKMKPAQRNEVHDAFRQKNAATLFCTDIAARGLDFPSVKWVVQLDCPDTVDTYVHRVGRTARAGANGTSLLILDPSQELFLKRLADRRVRLREIQFNPTQLVQASPLLTALNVQDPELKANAQKAVVSYLRSVYFESDKEVFNVHKIEPLALSLTYGLQKAPTLKFVEQGTKDTKNLSWEVRNFMAEKERREAAKNAPPPAAGKAELTKKERKRKSAHASAIEDQRMKLVGSDSEDDGDDASSSSEGVLQRVVTEHADQAAGEGDAADGDVAAIRMSKRALKKTKKGNVPEHLQGTHTVFDSGSEDGEGTTMAPFERAMRALKEKQAAGQELIREEVRDAAVLDSDAKAFTQALKETVKTVDVEDKLREKERVKAKHKLKKEKRKEAEGRKKKKRDGDDGDIAMLGGDGSDDEDDDDDAGDAGSGSGGSYDDAGSDGSGPSVEFDLDGPDEYGNVDSSSDDGSDESEPPAPPPKRRKVVVAKKGKKTQLESAEALALKMIG